METVAFSKQIGTWVSDCEQSKAHRLVYLNGDWRGKGCHSGCKKVGRLEVFESFGQANYFYDFYGFSIFCRRYVNIFEPCDCKTS